MHEAYVIEIETLSVGIVQRVRGGFRFYAAHGDFWGLDGQRFATPWRAQHAAEELLQSHNARRRKQLTAWTGQPPRQPEPPPPPTSLKDWVDCD